MAAKLPYYKMYPADAEMDEKFRTMDDTERGFYWRCLNHSWMNKGLDVDPEERSRMLGAPRKYADRMWLRVGRCFVLTENGTRYVNRRQEEERSLAERKSDVNTKAVRTRYERKPNEAIHALAHTDSASVASSKGGAGESAGSGVDWGKAGFAGPEDAEVWWQALFRRHSNKRGSSGARGVFLELCIAGQFDRKQFDGWYESQAATWEEWAGRGVMTTNLMVIFQDLLWHNFVPIQAAPKPKLEMPQWEKDIIAREKAKESHA